MRTLANTLSLTAIELADLVRLGDRLEVMIARLISRHGIEDGELLADGQAADLLSQRLAGMAAFVAALAESTPQEVHIDVVDAVRGLTLAEQVRRLAGPATLDHDHASNGELFLFGD